MKVNQASIIRCLAFFAALLLVSFLATGQTSAQNPTDPLEHSIAVSVMNERGEFVKDLSVDRFRASVRHHPVQILAADKSTSHRVVLLFDTSGSAVQENHCPLLIFAEAFLAETVPGTPLAIVTFASRIEDQTELSADSSPVKAELRKLSTTPWNTNRPEGMGKTALLDTIGAAVNLLEPTRPGDAILVMSDGGDNASHMSWGTTQSLLAQSGVRLFAVIPSESPMSRARTPEESQGPIGLHQLAQSSGGDCRLYDLDEFPWLDQKWLAKHSIGEASRLAPLLGPAQTFAREADSFYVLKVRLTEPIEKPQNLKLEVVDPTNGTTDRHLLLHYSRQLLPTASRHP